MCVTSLELLSKNRLASGSYDNTIKVWSIETGECLKTLTFPESGIMSMRSLANNLLAYGQSNAVQIWNLDLENGAVMTVTGHDWPVWALEHIHNFE
jgi:F-box/WD-40 domain protein MET30